MGGGGVKHLMEENKYKEYLKPSGEGTKHSISSKIETKTHTKKAQHR